MSGDDDTLMTRPFPSPKPIRDDRPKKPTAPTFCPACGGAFADACHHCGLTWLGIPPPSDEPLPAAGETAELAFSLSVLEAAADPYELMTSWRQSLPPGGLLRLTPPDGMPPAWRIPKRALMLLAERAGFRLVGRGWLRKTWLFRRY